MPLDGALRTLDLKRETARQRQAFAYNRRAEAQYAVQLRKVAKQIGDLIGAFPPGDPAALPTLTEVLRRYASLLRPWATKVAARMLGEVSRRDTKAWALQAKTMGAELRKQIATAPLGETLKRLMGEQVHYITSLPLDAAQRVHELTIEGLSSGTRAKETAQEILKSGHVSKGRANLIARTETARASSALTQVRAEHVGCTGYIWRTSRDGDVRKSHREMEGKFVSYDGPPPILSDGTQTHAGQIYNCRCYMEPVIPDIFHG